MNYWNEKDGRLSFETQLETEFLPPNNGIKNAWKNPCKVNWFSKTVKKFGSL